MEKMLSLKKPAAEESREHNPNSPKTWAENRQQMLRNQKQEAKNNQREREATNIKDETYLKEEAQVTLDQTSLTIDKRRDLGL